MYVLGVFFFLSLSLVSFVCFVDVALGLHSDRRLCALCTFIDKSNGKWWGELDAAVQCQPQNWRSEHRDHDKNGKCKCGGGKNLKTKKKQKNAQERREDPKTCRLRKERENFILCNRNIRYDQLFSHFSPFARAQDRTVYSVTYNVVAAFESVWCLRHTHTHTAHCSECSMRFIYCIIQMYAAANVEWLSPFFPTVQQLQCNAGNDIVFKLSWLKKQLHIYYRFISDKWARGANAPPANDDNNHRV